MHWGGGDRSLSQQPSSFTPILGFRNFKVFEKKNELFNINKKLVAFTLAEVLITLAIIGIVAALTIPVVVQKYKRKVVEVQLMKSYNTISNAFKLSEMDNGPLESWIQEDSKPRANVFFDKYLTPYIKTAEGSSENLALKDFGYKDGIKYPDGSTAMRDIYKDASYVKLNDGSIIIYGNWWFTNGSDFKILTYDLYVDVNGLKGPNAFGQDVFVFEMPAASGYPLKMYGEYITGYSPKDTNYIFYVKERSKEDIIKLCKKSAKNAYYCGAWIRLNGWKIPDNYPYL